MPIFPMFMLTSSQTRSLGRRPRRRAANRLDAVMAAQQDEPHTGVCARFAIARRRSSPNRCSSSGASLVDTSAEMPPVMGKQAARQGPSAPVWPQACLSHHGAGSPPRSRRHRRAAEGRAAVGLDWRLREGPQLQRLTSGGCWVTDRNGVLTASVMLAPAGSDARVEDVRRPVLGEGCREREGRGEPAAA